MRAGTLDRVVTIARQSNTLDEFRSPVMAWSTVATVRARIVEQATAETTGEPGAITKRTVTLESRFVAGIVPGDRLTFDGADYLVKDVREIGRRRGLTIVAEGTA